ncbi:hypothetical protein BKA70DRAFT_1470390 [Coprinopsis sp. MPI-PUGE-AT-0042]|nr:hypothetical protein BKA70DRAFT_1470390 [Coprinopsis sp. MPI-PUGE-AT-0042]
MSAVSTNSSVTESTDMAFRTASAGGSLGTPTTPIVASGLSPGGLPRSRKTSRASTVSAASTSTTKSVAIPARGRETSAPTGGAVVSDAAPPWVRKVSALSISSAASNAQSPVGRREKAPPVPPLDLTKLAPAQHNDVAFQSVDGESSWEEEYSGWGNTSQEDHINSSCSASQTNCARDEETSFDASSTASSPARTANEDLPSSPTVPLVSLASTATTLTTSTTSTSKTEAEHKTMGSASASSVATMRKRGSVDTITSRKASKSNESQHSTVRERVASPPLPALPLFEEPPPADYTPADAMLDIGTPCISCKRKRFKALLDTLARCMANSDHGYSWNSPEYATSAVALPKAQDVAAKIIANLPPKNPPRLRSTGGSGFGGSAFITSTSNGMNTPMLAGEEGDDRQWGDG